MLFTAGLALLLLAGIYGLVDWKNWDGWARPFSIFGTNAIFAFFGSTLLAKILILTHLQPWLFQRLFGSWLPDYVASLAYALAYVALWLGLTGLLYRRRIFLKI